MAADYGISSQGDYGSPSKSTSGGTSGIGGSTSNVGGIAPVVIGGYKSDGSATATNIPTLAVGAAIVIVLIALAIWHHKKS